MNVVLVGMPGCGKSTVGVLLAKSMLMDFIDTDLIIQGKFGKALCEIIEEYGNAYFINAENQILSGLTYENTVIATGGSAVYGCDAMKNLKENAVTVYLKLSPALLAERIKNIKTRGIAMERDCSLEELYIERAPLYEKYADITVDCTNLSVEDCVNDIIKRLK